MYTPETFGSVCSYLEYLNQTALNHKVWDFALAFRVRKSFKTFKKRAPWVLLRFSAEGKKLKSSESPCSLALSKMPAYQPGRLGARKSTPQLFLHCFVEPVLHHFSVYRQHQEWDRSASTLANREGTQVCFLFFFTCSLKYLNCVPCCENYVDNAFVVVALTE